MRWKSVRGTFIRAGVGAILLGAAVPAIGQDAGVPSTTTSANSTSTTAPSDPRAGQVRALIAGSLEVDVSPQSLFDVPLDEEAALQVEATRIRALLRAVAEAARSAEKSARPRTKRAPGVAPDAGTLRADLQVVDGALWAQRLELDRARFEFYELSPERRAELLRTHAERQEAARPREADEDRRAREAEAERALALEAARAARSEAERLVSEELARLIALENRVRASRDQFREDRRGFALRRDAVLGWQRRVRDAKAAGTSEADATYDALRRALRGARDELSKALDAVGAEKSDVPALGADPLANLPPDAYADTARVRRVAIDRTIAEARSDEQALREERAAVLLDEISTLNRERLGLLPHLSAGKRNAITGFTSAGWDQARSEARHLSLILRYHQHVANNWITTVRSGGGAGVSPWKTAAVIVPLLITTVAFFWGRRRTQPLLRWSEGRLAAADRAERRTTPSIARRAVRILLRIHRPLEWIAFFLFLLWLLPTGAKTLLEVQLASSAVSWTLAGSLIINTINAFAAEKAGTFSVLEEGEPGRLRLRSLRLVGRTIVVFALILVLSARLVGEGTIYNWVFSTCWFAAIPIFLLLVRWWRETVFERLDRIRKKTPAQSWILANRSGWKSFGAAMAGAVQLFATGTLKLARSWLSKFDAARRIHAYFYKREIERIGDGHAHTALLPISARALEEFHPERRARQWLHCPADELLGSLMERASARRGGVLVAVASRGMGKSTLLHEVSRRVEEHAFLTCRATTALLDISATMANDPSIVLIDDAHTLIEPCIGGFARFDELVVFVRAHAERTTWVVAIDASVWPLLKRARDARPMFDETHIFSAWNEEQLAALIADRCEAAGISPSYEGLLEKLPRGADEIDRQDALRAKRAGYERMVWDHVGGNPGLAMEVWRGSLGQDESGVVHVRPLRVPEIAKLERLPDSSLFVLRAVLQLAPTTAESVAEATRLRPEEVLQDLRFGKAQGFYEDQDGQVRIAWPWLRAASRLLERRHLLVSL